MHTSGTQGARLQTTKSAETNYVSERMPNWRVVLPVGTGRATGIFLTLSFLSLILTKDSK